MIRSFMLYISYSPIESFFVKFNLILFVYFSIQRLSGYNKTCLSNGFDKSSSSLIIKKIIYKFFARIIIFYTQSTKALILNAFIYLFF